MRLCRPGAAHGALEHRHARTCLVAAHHEARAQGAHAAVGGLHHKGQIAQRTCGMTGGEQRLAGQQAQPALAAVELQGHSAAGAQQHVRAVGQAPAAALRAGGVVGRHLLPLRRAAGQPARARRRAQAREQAQQAPPRSPGSSGQAAIARATGIEPRQRARDGLQMSPGAAMVGVFIEPALPARPVGGRGLARLQQRKPACRRPRHAGRQGPAQRLGRLDTAAG